MHVLQPKLYILPRCMTHLNGSVLRIASSSPLFSGQLSACCYGRGSFFVHDAILSFVFNLSEAKGIWCLIIL